MNNEPDNRMNTKQKLTLGITLGIAIVAVVGFSFSGIDGGDAKPAAAIKESSGTMTTTAPIKSTRTVEYRLISSNVVASTAAPNARPKASGVTVATPSGTTQVGTQYLPLSNKNGRTGIRNEFNPGEFLYISGQIDNYLTGKLTCEIYVEGKLVAQNTAQGDYSIVTCKATA